MKVAVIGTGLASTATIKALIDKGIKPTVLDVGESLSKDKEELKKQIAKKSPENWTFSERDQLFENNTIKTSKFPKKLAFGSDYFYGESSTIQKVDSKGPPPPFSLAKGGFSVGWGASVLPPSDDDLKEWPISLADLEPHFKFVLKDLSLSAAQDNLKKNFPIYSQNITPLELTPGNQKLINIIDKKFSKFNSKDFSYGQARMLTKVENGCQYCGECMSGCVYDYIYKSSQTIDSLIANGKIEYIPNTLVTETQDDGAKIKIIGKNTKNDEQVEYEFDKVFLGAGALNSTKIILKSKNLYDRSIQLKTTSGFVLPVFSFSRMISSWPNSNTQPGIFIEARSEKFKNHWIHMQVSTPNELVLLKMDLKSKSLSPLYHLKKFLLSFLTVWLCNLHSDHSNYYSFKLSKNIFNQAGIKAHMLKMNTKKQKALFVVLL